MANKTVSNLKEVTTVSNSDVLLVETSTETLKVTKGNLLKEVNEELNAKSDANHTHDEYVTESELNSKGLATEMFVTNKIAEAQLGNDGGNMDLSGYATTEYVDQEVGKTNAQLSAIKEHCTGGNGMQDHSHVNKVTLDKFSEKDGSVYYGDKELGGAIDNNSIGIEKLSDSSFGQRFYIENVSGTWLYKQLFYLGEEFSKMSGNDLKVIFDYTPTNTLPLHITCNQFGSQKATVGTVEANVKKHIEVQFPLNDNSFNAIAFDAASSGNYSFDGVVENLIVYVGNKRVNVSVCDDAKENCTVVYNEVDFIVSRNHLKNEMDEYEAKLKEEIPQIPAKNLEDGVVKYTSLDENVSYLMVGREFSNVTEALTEVNLTENAIGAYIVLDKKIYGKKIKTFVQTDNSRLTLGIASYIDSNKVIIDDIKTVGESWKPGEYEVNIDIPKNGGYLVMGGNFSTTCPQEYKVRILQTKTCNIGENKVHEVTQGYKYKKILIETESKVEELERILQQTHEAVSYTLPKGSSMEPVSTTQTENLKLIFSEDFKSENIDFKYTNCTYGATDGMIMNEASSIEYGYDVAVDTFRQKFLIKVNDIESMISVYTNANAKFNIDCINNKIISTRPVFSGTDTVELNLDFTIETNKYYILEVIKDGLHHKFTIYDKSTGKRTTLTKVVENSWGVGKVGLKCETGSITVFKYDYYQSLFPYTEAIFIGDSITEGLSMGVADYDISKRWCSLIRDNYFKGNALIFGKGYDKSDGALKRLQNLYRQGYSSKYVFIMIGTNESGSDEALAEWKVNIVKIYQLILQNNAIPVIITPPLSRTNVKYIEQMKDFIQEKGWDTIRMDLALSQNNDGVTYDNQYYKDGTHPNELGGQKMYERALYDLEMIM